MLKKFIILLLVLIIAVSSVAGCTVSTGKPEENEKTEGKENETGGVPEKRDVLEISVMTSNEGNRPFSPKMQDLLEKKFDIKFNMEYIDFAVTLDKFTAVFAAGNEPELIPNNNKIQALINQVGMEGKIYPINDDILDKVPNYMKWWADEQWKISFNICKALDGNLYYFPTPMYMNMLASYLSYWIYKKSGFDKLGLAFPGTMDELLDVAKKIKAFDPDARVFCATYHYSSVFEAVCNAYRTASGYYIDPDTNELTYGPVTDKYRDALKFMQNLYKEDLLLDKNLDTWDPLWRDVASSGKHWIWTSNPNVTLLTGSFANTKVVEPDAVYETSPVWPRGYADKPALISASLPCAQWGPVITKKTSNKKLERLLEMYDWLCTKEGALYGVMGIEGESYLVNKDGKVLWDPKFKTNQNPTGTINPYDEYNGIVKMIHYLPKDWYAYPPDPVAKADKHLVDYVAKGNAQWLNPLAWSLTPDESAALNELEAAINGQVHSFRVNFIQGNVTESAWDEYKQALYKAGLQKAIDKRKAIYERNK